MNAEQVAEAERLAREWKPTGFQQTIASMQVNHVPVETTAPTTEVAIKVDQRVRAGTEVCRVTP